MLIKSMQANAMVRRLLLTVMLLALPALANAAWQVSAKTSPSTAGIISPTGTKTFADTVVSGTFTVTPNSGYKISFVTLGGVVVAPDVPGIDPVTGIGVYTIPKFVGVKTLIAYLVPGSASEYVVSTSVTGGSGLVQAAFTSPPITALPRGGSYAFNITPGFGYKVGDVLVDSVSVGAVSSYTFVNLTSNHTISARFDVDVQVSASVATAGQMIAGTPVTLTGTATTNDTGFSSYMFQVTDSSLALVFSYSGPDTVAFFTPAAAGDYTVNYAATSTNGITGSATKVFNVSSVKIQSVANCCACHADRNNAYVTAYKSSRHYLSTGTVAPSCADCHNPGMALAHPGIYLPVDSCLDTVGCHLRNDPLHTVERGTMTCVTCHDPHGLGAGNYSNNQPHYNNMTSAGQLYPASYKSSQTVCADCHVATPENVLKRREWELSGHATTTLPGWMSLDFKTLDGCVRCHTSTGFKAYSTGKVTTAWGVASDRTKEVLVCTACHSDVAAGILRTFVPVSPYADDTYVNPDLGKSNLCMSCHSGIRNGKSITVQLDANTDFANLPFISPHFMSVGGTLTGQAGYNFPGRTYNSAPTHKTLGSLDGTGSCVTCHKNGPYGHEFKIWSSSSIGAIKPSPAGCVGCHTSSFDSAKFSADQAAFQNALDVLKSELALKGFVTASPTAGFSNTNWGTGLTGANTMGAAFNYTYLASEPAAFAHNPEYARQLVLDSIDYLQHGSITGSVDTASLAPYQSKNSCLTCHNGTTSTATPMASNAHGAHLSANYGPGSFLGNDINSCQACHVYGQTTHMNGVTDLAASGCVTCHPGTTPTWTSSARLDCTSCHAASASVINGVAAPYKANFGSTGHGKTSANLQCTACHDANSNHITGSLTTNKRLIGANDNTLCATCHNSAIATTHKTLDCRTCHDPHGTTNLSMIRTTITGNSATITYTDAVNGFIDTVTNRGLCQGCHTLTNHYRAGVAETNHYTSGCLSCHTHATGFKPAGGGCDSCHGYPPAPKVTSTYVPFGTTSNWSNARFEDYSGGGGAHLVMQHVSPLAVPSEGWANCTVCHNGGRTLSAPYHQMVTPVSTHISNVRVEVDPQYRFAEGFTIYTGAKQLNPPAQNATGSCFNIACHMTPSPRWSIER